MSVGVVAGFASGLVDGAANSIRKTLKGENRTAVLKYQFAFGSIFSLIIVALSGETIIKEVSLMPVLVGVLFAFLQIGLGNMLLYGFQHFDVNVGTVILASELVFAALIGYFFYNETLTSREILGGTIIFIAAIATAFDLSNTFSKRKNNAASSNGIIGG